MKLSVVIPCYNAANTIGAQLAALAAQRWAQPWEVLVADNGSTDDSIAIAGRYRDRLPHLRIVDACARRGQPYALNAGAAQAQGRSLAFCDADDEVAAGWLAAMGEALSNREFVACRIDTRKLNPSWIYSRLGNHAQLRGLQKNWYPPYLHHAGGGTLGVRRSLHQAIGGFDEELPYLHDTDYCFKLQLLGVPLHFVPDALAFIRYRDNLSALFDQARHWAQFSVKLYLKYRSLPGSEVSRPWAGHVREWKSLLVKASRIRCKADWALFLFNLGWQVGLLQGSSKYRSAPIPSCFR